MKNDKRNFGRIDALYIFWIVGCSSVLLDLDHLWKVFGLEAPLRLTYFAGREFHTPLVFIIVGCLFGLIITAYALGQKNIRWNMDISRTRAARYISSLCIFVHRFDSIINFNKSDIVLVSGSGGHLKRALLLLEYFKDAIIIIPCESEISKHKVKKNYVSVISPRFKAKSNRVLTIFRTLLLFVHSIILMAMIRPKIVISTGSGLSLPILLIARFFHIKTVYIESPSRVYKPSIAGGFLLRKTDRWIALWKELAERYSVEYGGMLS